MRIVYLTITQDDIDIGQLSRNDGDWGKTCPVAHAAFRILPNVSHVNSKQIVFNLKAGQDTPQVIDLPMHVRNFIHRADIKRLVTLGRLKPLDSNEPDAAPLQPFSFPVQYFE